MKWTVLRRKNTSDVCSPEGGQNVVVDAQPEPNSKLPARISCFDAAGRLQRTRLELSKFRTIFLLSSIRDGSRDINFLHEAVKV